MRNDFNRLQGEKEYEFVSFSLWEGSEELNRLKEEKEEREEREDTYLNMKHLSFLKEEEKNRFMIEERKR